MLFLFDETFFIFQFISTIINIFKFAKVRVKRKLITIESKGKIKKLIKKKKNDFVIFN